MIFSDGMDLSADVAAGMADSGKPWFVKKSHEKPRKEDASFRIQD